MENQSNLTATDSPSPPYHNRHSGGKSHSPLDSPAESSISSVQSSLSHGFSPREEDAPASLHGISPREEDAPASLHGISPREDDTPPQHPVAVPVASRYVRSEPKVVTKTDPGVGDGFIGGTAEEGDDGGRGRGKRSRPSASASILRRSNRDASLKKAALGFRVFGFLFCLISLSVLSADKNQGWALDSFYRYKEFRYALSVNVIGFVYSGILAIDLAYQLATGNSIGRHQLRYHLIFAIDQILSYLLISASSSASIRVEDWESNWGADRFPELARASVGMSFMAFVALAFSSLISGYSLYIYRSTQL